MSLEVTYTLEDLGKCNHKDACWIVIDGKVYDVTSYLQDHPGGEEVLLDVAGGDATEPFHDIGHSKDAKQILAKYEKGLYADYKQSVVAKESTSDSSIFRRLVIWSLPVIIGCIIAMKYII